MWPEGQASHLSAVCGSDHRVGLAHFLLTHFQSLLWMQLAVHCVSTRMP